MGEVSFDVVPLIAGALMDERDHWRQDAAARLRAALVSAQAARKKGDGDLAAFIDVAIIMPTVAALRGALTGDFYWPCCEGCGSPIRPGHVVYRYDEGLDYLHAECGDVTLANHLDMPEGAERWAEDAEFLPDGIAATLAEAKAYLGEREDG